MSSDGCGVRGQISAKKLNDCGYTNTIEVIHNPYQKQNVAVTNTHKKKYDLIVVSHYYSQAKDFPWMMQILNEVKKHYPALQVAFVGSQLKEKLKSAMAHFNLNDAFHFHGYKSGQELNDLYCSSRAILLTSHHEGLPMAIVEAMSHGLPCFSTNVGDIPWLIRDGIEGKIVDHGDTEKMATCIIHALNNNELCKMGENAQKRFDELLPQFQIDSISTAWNRLLNNALKQ